ncbi:MAG: chloride channel protein [Halofilum sp. (in: g-proteobacteria)]
MTAATRLRDECAGLANVGRRALAVSLLGLVLGGLASLAATGFVAVVEWLNDVLWVSARSRMIHGDWRWLPWVTVAVLATGGLLVGLLNRYVLPGGRVHGPPDVIEVAQSGHGRLSLRAGLASAGAAIASLGAGASVGQYGPLVHLGATLGSVIARWMPAGSATLGTIGIGCGVAAAISTAFNAPIAGILFAHEVILRHYSLKAFAPITVASTIGFVLTNFVFETRPLFRVDVVPEVAPAEFGAFIVLGIVGALVAIAFMRAVILAGRLARASRLPVPFRPAAAGAALGIMALWTPEVLGIGKETLRFAIIPEAFSAGELGLLMVAKIVATALCLGFGFAGGSFSPALVIGALYGALAGYVAAALVPGAADSVSVYAICGMAAVTSPVIGGPITTILIVFELTRNYELTTAVMVSVVFANLVSYRLFGRSMFDEALRARGCDLTMGRDQLVLDHSTIGAYITRHFVEAHPGESLGVLRDRLVAAEATEAQLIDAQRNYLGTITLSRLLVAIAREPNATVDHVADWDDEALRVDTSIWEALKHAESNIGEMLPVLEAGDSQRIVGVIAQSVIVRAYRDTMYGIRREEHAAP